VARGELGVDGRRAAAAAMAGNAGRAALFLNGIAGLGGPFWKPISLRASSAKANPGRGPWPVVESIAFLLQANIEEMAKHVPPAARIPHQRRVSQIDGLCRRLAALSDCRCTGARTPRRPPAASAT